MRISPTVAMNGPTSVGHGNPPLLTWQTLFGQQGPRWPSFQAKMFQPIPWPARYAGKQRQNGSSDFRIVQPKSLLLSFQK